MNEKKNQVVTDVAQESAAIAAPQTVRGMVNSTFDDIIVRLLSDKRNKLYRGLSIKKAAIYFDNEDFHRISLVLCEKVDGYVFAEEGYVMAKTNIIYSTIDRIALALRNDKIVAMPYKDVEQLLIGATIDLIQVPVNAGEKYISPFAVSDNEREYVSDHNWIANYISAIKIGTADNKVVNK